MCVTYTSDAPHCSSSQSRARWACLSAANDTIAALWVSVPLSHVKTPSQWAQCFKTPVHE